MESNETNMDYPISSRISSFLHFKEEKNAEEIIKKTASDELLLTRIIEEYKEGWHTFSEDDDAIWFFSRVLNVTSNERIKQLSRKNLIIALNRKAIRSIDKGHLDDAEKVLTKSFQKGLEDEHTHLFYSVLLRKIGLTKEADDELRRSMDLNPDIYYNTYALLLHRAGLVEEAEFHIRCREEIKNYLCSAIIALNGPSIYEMVRNGDKQVALSELLKEKAFLLETSPVLGTSTEIELIEEWRKFRDAVVNKRETKRKYRSLVKNAVGLWKECNELARQKNWSGTGVIFRPTTRAVGIPIKLYELALKNRNELADFLRDIYMWIIESSSNGERFPENTEIAHYLQIIKNLRHHFEHDREHGEVSKVKRKYVQVGRIFEELIGKQPLNEKDWYLLQIAVLLRVKGILTLTLEEVSKYRT